MRNFNSLSLSLSLIVFERILGEGARIIRLVPTLLISSMRKVGANLV